MTHTPNQILNGIINYADAEVMKKLPTSGKWVAGTAIGLATRKADNVIESLKDNSLISMLGVIDENGNVDTDTVFDALKESANKYGKLTLEVPLVGVLTFSVADIDMLMTYIK